MSSKKKTNDKKKNVSFIIGAGSLVMLVVVPIVLFVISLMLHKESAGDFTKSLYPIKYESYVESYSKEFGVDVCLVYGVIRTESGFDPEAVSQAGAIGLMQLMPDTFTWLQNYRTNFMPEKLIDSSKLYDPKTNIEYGTYLLRYLLDHYDGNTSLAIIAYNAGYGNVDKWLEEGIISKSEVTSDSVPFTETANYLTRVTESMEMYRSLYYSDLVYTYVPPEKTSDEELVSETDTEMYLENDVSANAEEPGETVYDDNYAFEGDGTGAEYGDNNEQFDY